MTDSLDKLLKNRVVPRATDGLVARIVAASREVEQDVPFGFVMQRWGRGFLDLFILPHPVYVTVAFLILGVCVGLMADASLLSFGVASEDLGLSSVWDVEAYYDTASLL